MPEGIVLHKPYNLEISYPLEQKQPKLLYLLCLTVLSERFGSIAMRGILVLYMTKILLLSQNRSYAIFAGFSALLYLAPFFGGYLATRFLGTNRTILSGGILLTIGYGLLALPGMQNLYNALAFITVGSGLFMPNIAGAVGQLYQNNDARREGGFSIFYAAINLGALIPPIIIASIIMQFGWHAGFLLASIGTLLGTFMFYFSYYHISDLSKAFHLSTRGFVITICLIFSIYLFTLLIRIPDLANKSVFILGTCFLIYTIKRTLSFSKAQQSRLFFCFFLTTFSIIFEVLLQQTGMSVTLFVDSNVQRNFGHWTMPTVMFQALNPFFIISCAPLLSKLWIWLDEKKLNPSVPTKFALGTLLMGVGFIVFPLAIANSTTEQISFLWVVVSYFLQSAGELLVSPVGLSMITEMSPPQMVGLMMGAWYFAIAIAQALAGEASQWTVTPSGNNIVAYQHTFWTLGIISIIAGLLVFMAVPKLKSMLVVKNS